MPELGSKISLISKADIRYEGRLFTVDPQECTIALASGKKKKKNVYYCFHRNYHNLNSLRNNLTGVKINQSWHKTVR